MAWDNDVPICKGLRPVTVRWQELDWKQVEKIVFKLQKRIYQASERGDVQAVRKLQKTLIRSWAARLWATRKVTQDNQGKRTAGVDGIKSLSPEARLKLANNLRITGKSKPTRRIWIPKPGTEEKRPLGIPTIYDRALQALVKLALEPEWEALFEPNSYGFRPGRSCHDAIGAIFKLTCKGEKWILDADISKCFDKINQEKLLKKIGTYPTLSKQLRSWLRAGVLDNGEFTTTSKGTPQGGVISPLLANIALHGMENRINQIGIKKGTNFVKAQLIRYADDFVILHEDLNIVQRCKSVIEEWLTDIGLELNQNKTRILHSLHKSEQEPGFDFLGFHIQQHKVGKYRAANTGGRNNRNLGFTLLITPSKKKLKEHLKDIAKVIDTHKNSPQEALIRDLNPIIRGWANYYSKVCSKKTFSKADSSVYQKLRAWAKRRSKRRTINKNKYWRNGWNFQTEDGLKLRNHSDTKVESGGHIKVQNVRSPYDGDWVYWGVRMGKHPELNTRTSNLLVSQKGKCPHCGLYFKDTDIVEVDHIRPKSLGGKDTYENLQLLHRHCHDQKTANDGSIGQVKSVNEKPPTNNNWIELEELIEQLEENPF